MESAVANLIAPGRRRRWSPRCGKFGERWAELCDAYGAETVHFETEWGEKVDPAEVDARARRARRASRSSSPPQSETSTGVVNDVRALAEVAHAPRRADRRRRRLRRSAPSDLPQDEWGVDVVVVGLAEGADVPARASASRAVSERALDARRRGARAGRYYFDWERTRQAASARTRRTARSRPPSTLFRALDVALELIEEEGLEAVFERHALLGRAAREAASRRSGLELLRPERRARERRHRGRAARRRSTAPRCPKLMRDRYGITIAGGQGQLKGKIVAHRALRLLRRLRHPRSTLAGARDGARRARPRRRARAPASAAAQHVFARGRRAAPPVG